MKVFRVIVVASLFFVLMVGAHAQTRLVNIGTSSVEIFSRLLPAFHRSN